MNLSISSRLSGLANGLGHSPTAKGGGGHLAIAPRYGVPTGGPNGQPGHPVSP